MGPFKSFSKVQHVTSVLRVAASHYREEERLSDKAPENSGSSGQFPWKIQLQSTQLYTSMCKGYVRGQQQQPHATTAVETPV